MIKKYITFTLVCLLLVTANFSVILAQTNVDKNSESIREVRGVVNERETGKKNRVKVIMADGKKLKGYVSEVKDDSFTLVESKTKQSIEIAYADVKKAKKRRSKSEKLALGIAIGAGVVGAAVLGIFLAARCNNEGC